MTCKTGCLSSIFSVSLALLAAGCGGTKTGGPGGDVTGDDVDAEVLPAKNPDSGVAQKFDTAGPSNPSPDTAVLGPDAGVGSGLDASSDKAGGNKDVGGDGPPVATVGKCQAPANLFRPIEKLSETGCMDPKDLTKMNPSFVGYEIASALWSDSADKERGFSLPPGGKIHVKNCAKEAASCIGIADDGRWVFPLGTMLIKNFSFDKKLVETRLLVRVPDDTNGCAATPCWVGYGYHWNEAQTEAIVVPDERVSIMFNTGTRMVNWAFPSRADCIMCHVASGGSTLGPETAQMNRNGADLKNQIDKYAAMGLFDVPPTKPYKAVLPTPPVTMQPVVGATGLVLEKMARSYLHANCAFCHRPDGNFPKLDLRFDSTLKETRACNDAPSKGDIGVTGATNLTPGKPMQSVIWLRMKSPTADTGRMPQIGSYKLDDVALNIVAKWITEIRACPP